MKENPKNMKLLLLFFLSFLCSISQAVAQWDSISPKTNFFYLFTKEKFTDGDTSVALEKHESIFSITLDTVIYLSGNDRKLFIFSKCMNEVLFNKSIILTKNSVNDANDIRLHVLGDYLYGGYALDNSIKQITIIYQIKNVTYLITSPTYFLKKLKDQTFVDALDKSLIKASSRGVIYNLNNYFLFDTLNMPINKFLLLKNTDDNAKDEPNIDNLGFLKFTNNNEKLTHFGPTDLYVSSDDCLCYNDIKVSKKYGIVKATSNFEDTRHGFLYETILELKKVDLPINK